MARKPKFTTPKNTLKEKVGEGGIPAYLLKQTQTFLESNPVDFTPYARRFLEDLEIVKGNIEKRKIEPDLAMKEMVNVIMQLKSNGSMFHYQLISMVSDVMLRFLEKAKKLDEDFLEIFNVYIKTLGIIVNKKLTGNAGREGYALTQELHNACLRYYSKYGISH